MVPVQELLTAALVLGALGYLARRGWVTVTNAMRQRKDGGCGPGCGCDGAG